MSTARAATPLLTRRPLRDQLLPPEPKQSTPPQRAETVLRARRRADESLLVQTHLRLAEALARRIAAPQSDWQDLRQVAYLGLVKAARRFDPARGGDFVSFAAPTIAGELKRHMRDHSWFVRPPRRVYELRGALHGVVEDLSQSLGREPTCEELARHVRASVHDVEEAQGYERSGRPMSIDAECVRDVLESHAAQTDGTDEVDLRLAVSQAVRRLDERERTVLYLRYFEGKTQREIGQAIGVSQMHVSRILSASLHRLRLDLEEVVA